MNIDNNVSHSVNYILLLGIWYINSTKINNRRIILTEFINLLKEKLESIKLTCTLNERGNYFSSFLDHCIKNSDYRFIDIIHEYTENY